MAGASDTYDTVAAASLSGETAALPPFYGLLNTRNRPHLQCEVNQDDAIIPQTACHPLDDSFVVSSSSDSRNGILVVSDIAMSMRYTVIVPGKVSRESAVRKIIQDVFKLINSVANGWSKTSEITLFNHLKAEKKFKMSKDLSNMLDVVDELFDITDGRFDPSCGVLKLAFLETIKDVGRPLVPDDVKHFRFAMGWRKKIIRKGLALKKANANTIVDLDGMSKGYCIDLIVSALHRAGYENCYVDWAGDIHAVGHHPSGRPWRTAIVTPPPLPRLFEHWKKQALATMLSENDVGHIVNMEPSSTAARAGHSGVAGVALATSGDYFQIQKFGFHHIMRSTDRVAMKASVRSTGSASVLAATCALADGIATAAMTFDRPKEAAAFLDGIVKRMPDRVFGYCVAGRGADADNAMYCTSQFTPTSVGNGSDATSSSKSMPRNASVRERALSADDLSKIQNMIVRKPGRLIWSSGSVHVDALTPCSMNPDPRVSFIVPGSLSDAVPMLSIDAKVREGKEDTLKFEYIGREIDGNPEYSSIQFSLRVADVFKHGDISVVIAQIVEASQGESRTVSIVVDGARRTVNLQRSFMRDDFLYRSVTEQAKEAFSELPSSVCVFTTESADASHCGLTATSLTISDYSKNLICFNIMHSSTFFAAFAGVESTVTVHCLASGRDAFAKDFAAKSVVDAAMQKTLAEASMCILKGVAKVVETVEDHAIVLAELRGSTFASESLSPLIWHRRRYCAI